MKRLATKAILIPGLVAGVMAVELPSAGAQTLFDTVFGSPSRSERMEGSSQRPRNSRIDAAGYSSGTAATRQREQRRAPVAKQERRQQQQQRRAAAPIAKISSPSYYDYKAVALQRVDFAPLAAIGQSASLDAVTTGTAFRGAVGELSGYELYAEPGIGKALVEYYSTNPDFIWVSDGEPNDRARAALRILSDAASHGLSPADYAVSVPASAGASGDVARKADAIRFEMELSSRVLRYARDAQGGRVNPNKLSGYHDFPEKPFDVAATLETLSGEADVRRWLETQHPDSNEYRVLRVELEALRASAENDIVVDPRLLLKPGETNAELAKILHLIARDLDDEMGGEYGELLQRTVNSETYGEELIPVIKAAQAKAGLSTDGVIGPRTVSALAGASKADRIGRVLVALEQLRWHPHELGATRVFINQPAYTAQFIDNGVETLNMRTVIGRASNQTTFFYDELNHIDYNPYWGVPQSIIVNEMLPRLRNDPGYLDRAGYEVTDSKGRRIASSSINWWQYGSRVPYNVRQTPSEANALGELKIMFPNKHAIYMHDTPQKDLFNRDVRAFSHGCVRLHDPRGMAAAVLGKTREYVEAKLKQGHATEKTLKIPVYVAYFTAWPDKNGKVAYFDDVYDRDSRVLLALEKTDAVRVPSS